VDLASTSWWDPITVTATTGTGQTRIQGSTVWVLVGSRFDDHITAGSYRRAYGLFGDDRITAGAHTDVYGDAGNDRLEISGSPGTADGGPGDDQCDAPTTKHCEGAL